MFRLEFGILCSGRSSANYVLAGVGEIPFWSELKKLRSRRSWVNYVLAGVGKLCFVRSWVNYIPNLRASELQSLRASSRVSLIERRSHQSTNVSILSSNVATIATESQVSGQEHDQQIDNARAHVHGSRPFPQNGQTLW